jgi:DNA-binding beta-propeller fold protein YncE
MKRLLSLMLVVSISALVLVGSCKRRPVVTPAGPDGNYPVSVASIFVNKCAISGCHNAASYQNADNLLLDTWDNLFKGSNNGAEVVAYSTKYSPLLYYVNTDPSLGVVASDPGHLTTPISLAEYDTLVNWISRGAPDKNGNIPFASNASTRQKIYLTNQGCNLLAVIDAQSRVVMRYIPIGDAADQAPHDVEISDDGVYAYVPFYNGSYVQKIDTRTDTVVGTTNLGSVASGGTGGGWSIVILSPADTAIMVSGFVASGYVVTVNTANMQINAGLSVNVSTGGTQQFVYPHGLESNTAFDTFYATLQYGNVVNKFWFNPSFGYKYVTLDGGPAVTTNNATTPDPHQIQMSPDHSKYFVTCENTNEVRVMDVHTDTLIKVIPVGTFPQEMDISPSKNYLFVACMEDAANPQPGCHGSVYVIDINTLQTVKILYGDFYQPHDITVDEQDGLVFIPSRNANPNGPAPHHATACNGRAGWYSVYDLNTLAPADNKRYDVTVDPYAISARF